jgi:hypothetical protein
LGHASAHHVLEHTVVRELQRQHSRGAVAVTRMQRNHVALANREVGFSPRRPFRTGPRFPTYGICMPEMARTTTSRWISDVLSMMV